MSRNSGGFRGVSDTDRYRESQMVSLGVSDLRVEAEEKKCRIPEGFPSALKRCEMDLEVA